MSRIRVVFMSLLAVFAVSSVASATASAEVQGPWYMKLSGGKQVKIEPNEHLKVKSINEGAFILKGKALGENIVIECRKVEDSGTVWNGKHQGQDETETKFSECFAVKPCAGFPVTVGIVNTDSELMWKYRGVTKELEEAGGQQKIYDMFAPKEAPKEIKPGSGTFESIYTSITITPEFEGKKCALATEAFFVFARGSLAKWEDQEGKPHEVVWGTAALVEPQNVDTKVGHLKWALPNQKKLHHQGGEQIASLVFGSEPAELEGTIKIEDETGLVEWGAWNEV